MNIIHELHRAIFASDHFFKTSSRFTLPPAFYRFGRIEMPTKNKTESHYYFQTASTVNHPCIYSMWKWRLLLCRTENWTKQSVTTNKCKAHSITLTNYTQVTWPHTPNAARLWVVKPEIGWWPLLQDNALLANTPSTISMVTVRMLLGYLRPW